MHTRSSLTCGWVWQGCFKMVIWIHMQRLFPWHEMKGIPCHFSVGGRGTLCPARPCGNKWYHEGCARALLVGRGRGPGLTALFSRPGTKQPKLAFPLPYSYLGCPRCLPRPRHLNCPLSTHVCCPGWGLSVRSSRGVPEPNNMLPLHLMLPRMGDGKVREGQRRKPPKNQWPGVWSAERKPEPSLAMGQIREDRGGPGSLEVPGTTAAMRLAHR